MSIQITSIAGPEKGCVVTVVKNGGESSVMRFCPVCGCETYLSFDFEESSGMRFCTNHWAVLRYAMQTAVQTNANV